MDPQDRRRRDWTQTAKVFSIHFRLLLFCSSPPPQPPSSSTFTLQFDTGGEGKSDHLTSPRFFFRRVEWPIKQCADWLLRGEGEEKGEKGRRREGGGKGILDGREK